MSSPSSSAEREFLFSGKALFLKYFRSIQRPINKRNLICKQNIQGGVTHWLRESGEFKFLLKNNLHIQRSTLRPTSLHTFRETENICVITTQIKKQTSAVPCKPLQGPSHLLGPFPSISALQESNHHPGLSCCQLAFNRQM